MDKRSLLFILLITMSFLGIRAWYEKQHQIKLTEWNQQYGSVKAKETSHIANNIDQKREKEFWESDSTRTPIAAVPVLFELPLVYTHFTLDERELIEVPPLLSQQVINNVGNTLLLKNAYGFMLHDNAALLFSSESNKEWPNAVALTLLKTNQPIEIGEDKYSLRQAFNPSYALFTASSRNQASSADRAYVASSQKSADYLPTYAIIFRGTATSDPEAFSIQPVEIKNQKVFTKDNTLFHSDFPALLVRKSVFQPTFLPLGAVFATHTNSDTGLTKKLVFFDQEASLQMYLQGEKVANIENNPHHNFTAVQESYYILENEYQQFVFSSLNAAITEINLPFTSKNNTKSVVKAIPYDKTVAQVSPHNARFPLALDCKNYTGSVVNSVVGGYYPLLRRPLMSDISSTIIARIQPQHQACVLTSTHRGSIENISYKVINFSKNSICFQGVDHKGRHITKTYAFPENTSQFPYCLDITISVDGKPYKDDIMLTTGVPEIEWMSGTNGASLGYCQLKKNSSTTILDRIDLPSDRFQSKSISPHWIMNSNGFFALILKPLTMQPQGVIFEKVAGSNAPSRLVELNETSHTLFKEEDLPGYQSSIGLALDATTTSTRQQTVRFYAGPLDEPLLSDIDANSKKEAAAISFDFSKALTYQGWFTFISEPFARLLYFFMKQFHKLIGSWGLSIVFATVLLRILLYPLNSWSMNSMRKMQQISPMIKSIQEKHKKEPAKAQMEMMNLYREKGVNPLSGCLPLLIQMPFLVGMFDLLKSTFSLRGAPFIPGWITDLSSPDIVALLPISLPFIGNQLHALPIILGLIMWIQQAMTSKLPKNPEEWTDQQRQQKSMGTIMTVVMTIMFYNFPSGLNIYWISSMLLGLIQQWWSVDRLLKNNSKFAS